MAPEDPGAPTWHGEAGILSVMGCSVCEEKGDRQVEEVLSWVCDMEDTCLSMRNVGSSSIWLRDRLGRGSLGNWYE